MSSELTKETKGKKRRIGMRLGLWTISLLCFGTTILLFVLMGLMGTRVHVPDWIEARIVERLNRSADGFSLTIEDMSVTIEEGWVPRLQLQGVGLADSDGVRIVHLADVQTIVALKPLFRGLVKSRAVSVVGAQAVLRRDSDGQIDLSIGGGAVPGVEKAPNIAALIGEAHQVFENPHFDALRRVELRNLTMVFEDARVDKVWTVDGAEVALDRVGQDLQIRGDFALLGARDFATALSVNYEGQIGTARARFGLTLEDMPSRDISGQSPALSWLNAIDAPISGAIRGEMDEAGALARLDATLQLDAGVVQPNTGAQPVAFTALRSYLRYDPAEEKIIFDELLADSKWGQFTATGTAHLVGMELGWPETIVGQIDIQELSANPAGVYPQPIQLEGVHADLKLQLEPFVLEVGSLSVVDQDLRGNVSGAVAAQDDGWDIAINARLNAIRTDRLLELWPEAFKPKPRTWIADNVIDAQLENAQFSMRFAPQVAPDFYLGFEFRKMATRFVAGLPPIKAASGRASLVGRRFVISADKGHVIAPQGGLIDVAGTSFVIPDTDISGGPAQVVLRTKSTITAALALLDEKPFEFMKKAGRPVVLADGLAEVSGQIDILLKNRLLFEDVQFDLLGHLSEVRSDRLVPGKELTAKALKVQARQDRLEISGTGRIGQVPFGALWGADLGPEAAPGSRVEGWVELSARFLDEFRIGLPKGSLTGEARAPIVLDLPKEGAGSFKISSDLAGIGLRLKQLDWSSPEQARGRLEVSGRLAEPVVVDLVELEAKGLQARGNVSLKADGGLDRVSFTQVQVGEWLDAPVELVGQGNGQPPAIRILGGSVDLQQATFLDDAETSGGGAAGGAGAAGDHGPMSLVLDEVTITDSIRLTNVKAQLETANGLEGAFTGEVNGNGRVNGWIVPQKKGKAFVIRSEDAGTVLASAGIFKNAHGGAMEVRLVPSDVPGAFEGQLEAQNLRLTDAPTMAALLNAVSIVGLVEQMAGEGIHFRTVDGRFQLAPERVTVYSGSAVGPSMGISIDGYYDTKNEQLDMQGVISPVYALNALGGAYSRKGEGLFGFNFTLQGTAESPDVYVNPLTALAPGLFRELFRRPAPKVGQPDKPEAVDDEAAQEQTRPKSSIHQRNDR